MLINILKYGFSEGVAKLAPFLTTLYVAKFLSPELFGKYSLVIVLFEIFFIIISFNIQATTRIDYFKESKVNFYCIKRSHFSISLLLATVGVLSSFFFVKDEQLIIIVLIFSALLRTGSVFVLAIFQCSRKVNAYIYSNITFVVTLSVSILLFLEMGLSYFSWLYAMFLASLIQFILVLKLYGIESFISFRPKGVTLSSLKYTLIPAALFMPQAIGWWLKSGAERLIISSELGNASLGIYSLAMQFVSIMFIYVTVVNLAIVPEINKLMEKNNYEKTNKYLLINVFLLICVALLIPLVGSQVISNFYSLEYLPVNNYILLLTLACIPQAIMMLYINVLYYNQAGRFVATLILLSFSIQTLINYFFINIYGILGLIICSGIVNTLALYLILIKVFRHNVTVKKVVT